MGCLKTMLIGTIVCIASSTSLWAKHVDPILPFTDHYVPNLVTLKGDITNFKGIDIEGVTISLNGTPISTSYPGFTTEVSPNQIYHITAEKNQYLTNGVSTQDIILMKKHLLGIQTFYSPYQYFAADVNNDKKFSLLDIINTRQVLLEYIDEFPNNASNRFFDAAADINEQDDPLLAGIPEYLHLAIFDNIFDANLIGVKVGDINGNSVSNSITEVNDRNDESLDLVIENKAFAKNDIVSFEVKVQDFYNVEGCQFSLEFDPSILEFYGMESGELPDCDAQNFGLDQAESGIIHFSWDHIGGTTLPEDGVLFSLKFTAKADADLKSSLGITNRHLAPEAYLTDTEILKVDLSVKDDQQAEIKEGKFSVDQNAPNPFNDETVVNFYLPERGEAVITVFDPKGNQLFQHKQFFEKGENSFTVNAEVIIRIGVLYYEVKQGSNKKMKKMIVVR